MKKSYIVLLLVSEECLVMSIEICNFYNWRASETLSGVTNGSWRYMYIYIYVCIYMCVVRETSL